MKLQSPSLSASNNMRQSRLFFIATSALLSLLLLPSSSPLVLSSSSSSSSSTPQTTRRRSSNKNNMSSSSSLKSTAAVVVFDNTPLWQSTGVFALANALGLAISWRFPQAHYHVDLLGTGAFAVAALVPLSSAAAAVPARVQLSAAAVILWSVKLASFLWYRVWQIQHDARLNAPLSTVRAASGFWCVSFLWGVLASLPHTLGTTSSASAPLAVAGAGAGVGNILCRYSGVALYGLGLLVETLADYQKWTFKQQNPAKQFCNVGLWGIVQHPNWLGNLMLWWGIFLFNAPALVEPTLLSSSWSPWQKVWSGRRLGLALLGPAFLWILFNAQATGKILDETRQANLKKYGYGKDHDFTKYIDTTPLILPNPLVMWLNIKNSNNKKST